MTVIMAMTMAVAMAVAVAGTMVVAPSPKSISRRHRAAMRRQSPQRTARLYRAMQKAVQSVQVTPRSTTHRGIASIAQLTLRQLLTKKCPRMRARATMPNWAR